MPLRSEAPSAVRYLVPGAVAGLVCFAFSRLMIEPLIGAAVDYEGERAHAESQVAGTDQNHGHELFSRAVQENAGAGVGIVAFGMAMGALFAVVHTVIRGDVERRALRPNPVALALLLSAGMFVVIALMPAMKYPANPPTVGLDDTVAVRSSAFLTILAVSVVGAIAAVAVGLAWSRRWGGWRATAVAAGGYLAVMLCAMVLLPGFEEVPGPVPGSGGLVLAGFPAQVLADFRVYSLVNQALLWLVIGTVSACAAHHGSARRRSPLAVAYGDDR